MAGKYGEPTQTTYLWSIMKWILILCLVGPLSVGLLRSSLPGAGVFVIGLTAFLYVRETLSFMRRHREAYYHRHYAKYRKPLSSSGETSGRGRKTG